MFPAIMPWPMTLAPTNKAVRRKNHAEKNLYMDKPIGPAALWHMDRQTVSSIYYYCYVRTYVVGIMYDT
jgi:hypothetical protein